MIKTKVEVNDELHIGCDLTWSSLKYGLCGYFSLAWQEKYPLYDKFLAVMEYDEELEQEYLVHFLVIYNDMYLDAYGVYASWREAVNDITDIEFMNLSVREVSKGDIIKMIEEDMSFNDNIYSIISDFVSKVY